MTPTLILVAIIFVGLGIDLARHGEPKTGTHNAGISLFATAVVLALYWWAGLFDVFGG